MVVVKFEGESAERIERVAAEEGIAPELIVSTGTALYIRILEETRKGAQLIFRYEDGKQLEFEAPPRGQTELVRVSQAAPMLPAEMRIAAWIAIALFGGGGLLFIATSLWSWLT